MAQQRLGDPVSSPKRPVKNGFSRADVRGLADMDVRQSPGSEGRKLRSQASQSNREKGKNKMGRVTHSTMATNSILAHGTFGAAMIIQPTGTPSAITSPITRLKTYAPIQKSDRSPRSSARPHVAHVSRNLSHVRRIPLPPHRGQRKVNARTNRALAEDLRAGCWRRASGRVVPLTTISHRPWLAVRESRQLSGEYDVHRHERQDDDSQRNPRDHG